MPLYTHSSGDEFTQSETYGWFEKALIVLCVVLFAACIFGPLWFGTLQFSDFFSFGRALWVSGTGS